MEAQTISQSWPCSMDVHGRVSLTRRATPPPLEPRSRRNSLKPSGKTSLSDIWLCSQVAVITATSGLNANRTPSSSTALLATLRAFRFRNLKGRYNLLLALTWASNHYARCQPSVGLRMAGKGNPPATSRDKQVSRNRPR